MRSGLEFVFGCLNVEEGKKVGDLRQKKATVCKLCDLMPKAVNTAERSQVALCRPNHVRVKWLILLAGYGVRVRYHHTLPFLDPF